MKKTFIAVTTYKKPEALEVFIQGLLNNKYLETNTLCIADDGMGKGISKEDPRSALDVYEKYKKEIPDLRFCHGAARLGVGGNKNRAINHFFESLKKREEYDYFVIFDDDVEPFKPGLLHEFEIACNVDNQQHVNGYWTKQSLTEAFPPRAITETCMWSTGCQGVSLFFTRELLEQLGFFPVFKQGLYGYEHSLLSARAMMYQGYAPDLYVTLNRFGRFVKPQNIPNRYEVPPEKLHANSPEYWESMQRVRQGLDLQVHSSHLAKKAEIVLRNKDKR